MSYKGHIHSTIGYGIIYTEKIINFARGTNGGSLVLFLLKVGDSMYIRRDIHCPKCWTKVATYDGRATMNVLARCTKCRKRVIFHVDTKTTTVEDFPQRNTSSGKMLS